MNKFGKFVTGVLGATAVTAVVLDARGRYRWAKDTQKPYYKNHHKPYGFYEKYVKRPLDCILASGALVVFSPILLTTSVLVKKKLGSPVLFTQDRPGKDGKIFKLYKFRTMTDERDENGELLPDEDRLKEFGKKLRSTSLDELPELINIAEGDMAVIGPRPLLVRYLGRYDEEQIHRHDVRPGLTGLAQANGRNELSWSEKFNLDTEYVKKITFIGDLKILAETVNSVMNHEGISSETSATMEEFMGNKG
ncbi:MAG: sugar transferase [Blautia sp.]|nr:sugar transferase [Blautia sp.]